METMKMRALQQPTQLKMLIESLVVSWNCVPSDDHLVRDLEELPSALQQLARRADNGHGAWRSWCVHDGFQLLVAEMSLVLSKERGRPVLQSALYSGRGKLQEYSTWVRVDDNNWQRCTL